MPRVIEMQIERLTSCSAHSQPHQFWPFEVYYSSIVFNYLYMQKDFDKDKDILELLVDYIHLCKLEMLNL